MPQSDQVPNVHRLPSSIFQESTGFVDLRNKIGKTRPRIGLNSSVREASSPIASSSSSVMTPHHSYDPQVAVHNGQILKAVLAHDFQCLIHRLIFEAVVGLFFHHTMDELSFAEIIRDRRRLVDDHGRVFRL